MPTNMIHGKKLNYSTLSVYPNPANNKLQLSGLNYPAQYYLCNYIGETILTGMIKPEHYIDVASLGPGIYFLTIKGQMLKVVIL